MTPVRFLRTLPVLLLILEQARPETHSRHAELCGDTFEIKLSNSGYESSVILDLIPPEVKTTSCKLIITPPKTHHLYIHLVENDTEVDSKMPFDDIQEKCPISVFLGQNTTAAWGIDPCSQYSVTKALELRESQQILIIWTPSWNARNRKMVVTALGDEPFCQTEFQHTCRGSNSVVCISKELLCDGISHCPDAADEEIETCETRRVLSAAAWERIASEIYRKFAGKKTNTTPAEGAITTTEPTTTTTAQSSDSSDLATALAHYGPWGYLMLGMLICGTVLMFCGLWECCFRSPKPSSAAEETSVSQPTAVVVIDSEEQTTPPNYEELDQPPSYNTLFPNKVDQ